MTGGREREAPLCEKGSCRYRSLFDSVQDIVYLRGLDGVILDINPAGLAFFGRSYQQMVGATLHDTESDLAWAALQQTNQRLIERGGDRSTVHLQGPGGEARILESTVTLLRDVLGKPIGACGVMRDITEAEQLRERLEQVNTELERLATSDPLLGIANRRRLDDQMASEHRRSVRFGHPYGVLFVDVDHFKGYNDRYGHAAGDQALQEVARCLLSVLREVDLLGRYGGEEFMALLPESGGEVATQVAERMRSAVQDAGVVHDGAPTGQLTVSIGVAVFARSVKSIPESDLSTGDHSSWRQVIEGADRALYRAKRAGRNRVAVESLPG